MIRILQTLRMLETHKTKVYSSPCNSAIQKSIRCPKPLTVQFSTKSSFLDQGTECIKNMNHQLKIVSDLSCPNNPMKLKQVSAEAQSIIHKLESEIYQQHLEAGLYWIKHYKLDKACIYFNEIVSKLEGRSEKHLMPILIEAYVQKGCILSKGNARETDEALECFKKALKLDPNSVSAQEKMDGLLYERGELRF